MKKLWALLAGMMLALLCAGCAQMVGGAEVLPGLRINEVVSSNGGSLSSEALGTPDWIELYNGTGQTIDLTGYGLTKSEKDRFRYTFPALTIEPGEYLIVYCCAPRAGVPEGAACSGFKLSREGETLWLSEPSGAVVQQLKVPALETDVSYGLDEQGVYRFFAGPTPGAQNTGTAADSLEELAERGVSSGLRISEVLPYAERFALEDGTVCGWAELYNAGETAVELSEYTITEDAANFDKATLPAGTLEPGEYVVVRFSDGGEGSLPFRIGKDESELFLFDRFGRKIDSLSWTPEILPDASAGRNEEGLLLYYIDPTPGGPNGPDGTEDGAFPLEEGTPAIRINEVLRKNTYSVLDADGDRSPWVELYNPTDEVVPLADYALSDDPEEPWKWYLPEDGFIEPHGYMIVWLDGKGRSEGELHTSFRLGSSDSVLTLTERGSRVRQSVLIDPESKDNVSYGVDAQGQWMYFPQPTPLAPNETKGFTTVAAAGGAALFGVRINEVSAVSRAKSGKTDWIELYNCSDTAVDLAGWYLSDSSGNFQKWPLSGVVAPGGYLVVQDPGGEELTLSSAGERLYLTEPNGALADRFDYGVLRAGYSSGRSEEAGREGVRQLYAAPTPGAKNGGTVYEGYCTAPVFSRNGGYADEAFLLEMSAPAEQEIHYTTDGSTPDGDAALYTGPIEVKKTMTVRAAAFAQGRLSSDETVATYLFEERHSLPVVCLSMTQSDLDYVFGSADRRDDRERQGYVEYYEEDGALGVRFPAGFRIAGNGTRLYAQRSINLYLRGGYGLSKVTYPFFDDYDIHEFKSLSLRNMGQDNHLTRIRDAFFSMAVKGMNLDYMETRFAVVYLNGKYWGLYEFKENQNEDYLASRHDIDADDVMMSRSNTYVYNGKSNRDIKELFAMARGNLADEQNFKKYLARTDSDYFTDYLIAQCFFANADVYNQKYAGTLDRSLKWRPVFYDLDWAFMGCNPKRTIMSSFFSAEGIAVGAPDENGERNHVDTALYYGFYKNAAWREQFVERYAEVLNTILTTGKLLERFDAMVAEMETEMERTIDRWGKPSSLSAWRGNIQELRKCIEERRPYAIQELKNFFGLSEERIKELFPNG